MRAHGWLVGLCLSVVPSAALAAETTASPPARRAPVVLDLDATVLHVGVAIAGHLGGGVYLGARLAALPAASVNTFDKYVYEMYGADVFVRYAPIDQASVDLGAQTSHFQEFRICVFGPCTVPAGELYGAYLDARFGWPHVKLGPRLAFAVRSDTAESGVMVYPLLITVRLTP